MPKYYQLVSTIELPDIHILASDTTWTFRIEIFKDVSSQRYFPRVYRWESFTVQPTYPSQNPELRNQLADHDFLVTDYAFDYNKMKCDTCDEAINTVLKEICETFNLPLEEFVL